MFILQLYFIGLINSFNALVYFSIKKSAKVDLIFKFGQNKKKSQKKLQMFPAKSLICKWFKLNFFFDGISSI
jgi:hypothetical protein